MRWFLNYFTRNAGNTLFNTYFLTYFSILVEIHMGHTELVEPTWISGTHFQNSGIHLNFNE